MLKQSVELDAPSAPPLENSPFLNFEALYKLLDHYQHEHSAEIENSLLGLDGSPVYKGYQLHETKMLWLATLKSIAVGDEQKAHQSKKLSTDTLTASAVNGEQKEDKNAVAVEKSPSFIQALICRYRTLENGNTPARIIELYRLFTVLSQTATGVKFFRQSAHNPNTFSKLETHPLPKSLAYDIYQWAGQNRHAILNIYEKASKTNLTKQIKQEEYIKAHSYVWDKSTAYFFKDALPQTREWLFKIIFHQHMQEQHLIAVDSLYQQFLVLNDFNQLMSNLGDYERFRSLTTRVLQRDGALQRFGFLPQYGPSALDELNAFKARRKKNGKSAEPEQPNLTLNLNDFQDLNGDIVSEKRAIAAVECFAKKLCLAGLFNRETGIALDIRAKAPAPRPGAGLG